MKKIIATALLCISFISFAGPAEDAVEYRQAAFKLIKANLGPMGAMVKGKVEYDAKVFNKHAINLKALSSMPWTFFDVEDSDIADGTKAKESVWSEEKKFKAAIKHFKKVVSALDKAANTKADLASLKPLFADVAKTCKGCHKNFKEK